MGFKKVLINRHPLDTILSQWVWYRKPENNSISLSKFSSNIYSLDFETIFKNNLDDFIFFAKNGSYNCPFLEILLEQVKHFYCDSEYLILQFKNFYKEPHSEYKYY